PRSFDNRRSSQVGRCRFVRNIPSSLSGSARRYFETGLSLTGQMHKRPLLPSSSSPENFGTACRLLEPPPARPSALRNGPYRYTRISPRSVSRSSFPILRGVHQLRAELLLGSHSGVSSATVHGRN